jgi:hypothetical protein
VRRSILFTLSATLIACGTDEKTHVGEPCQADRTCDSGQICDQTDPGGPVCLDASGDVDSDGIQNDKDFCEHVAGGDHDEDIDGIGDECDPCPIAKPSTTAQTDGDGVDGACDPDTSRPGDKIVLFNGFNAAPTSLPSGWKIQGGEAIFTPTGPNAVGQLDFMVPVPSNHMAIQVGYRIDSVDPGATEADAGVVSFIVLPVKPPPILCVGSRRGPLDQLLLDTGSGSVTSDLMNLFNPASLYRIGEQLDGTTAKCALASDKETGAIQGSTDGSALNQVGLYARGATVRFAYLLVTQR